MKDIELPPPPEPTALGMDFDKGWDGVRAYGYTEEDLQAYARAAVESDRAQRVPDGWVLIATDAYEAGFGKGEQAHKTGKDVENPWGDEPGREAWAMGYALGKERAASTPAPAQQEPNGAPMNSASGVLSAIWDAMQNSADGDDLLNKLECLRDGIEQAVKADQEVALQELATDAQVVYGAYAAKHQEPPQQERGPMTTAQITDARKKDCFDPDDEPEPWSFRMGVVAAERHHGIRKD